MKKFIGKAVILFAVLLGITSVCIAEGETEQQYNWVEGGKNIEIQNGMTSINLDKDMYFLNRSDTISYQKSVIGNDESGKEIGSIYPVSEDESWFVVMEYNESGYVKDNEKINAKDLLKSYKEGQKEYNKEHAAKDRADVVGWEKEPYYDSKTNYLSWSIMYMNQISKETYANHNVKVLTRKGYISFILVANNSELAVARETLDNKIIPKFIIENGNRYSDFNAATDKVAEYGIAGLVLGGVALGKGGWVAILLGMKKLLIVIGAGLAGAAGWIGKKIFGNRQSTGDIQIGE